MNMSDCAINEYIYLSKLFGGCLDMVQGKGGNISVKDGDKLIIKQSGFCMGETTLDKGYVVCSISAIQEKFAAKDEDLQSTVLQGTGRPSMESFFHILPHKYVVHLHPTFLMNLLCQPTLKKLNELFPSAFCIPYIQPGFDLSETIHRIYDNQGGILFLQNHGVIFLEDTLEDIMDLIVETFETIQKEYPMARISDIRYLQDLYDQDGSWYWKSSYMIPNLCYISQIKSFTPDIHLFLTKTFHRYVHIYEGYCYIGGPSKESMEITEQMMTSYILCNFDPNCIEIPCERTQELEQNPQEKARLGQ